MGGGNGSGMVNSIDDRVGFKFVCAGRGKFMEGLISTLSQKLPAGFLDPTDQGGFLTDVVIAWAVVLAVLFALNFIVGVIRRSIAGDENPMVSGFSGGLTGPAVRSAYQVGDVDGAETSSLDGLEPIMRRDRKMRDVGAFSSTGPVRPRGAEPVLRHQVAYHAQGLKSKTSVGIQGSRKKRKKAK